MNKRVRVQNPWKMKEKKKESRIVKEKRVFG